MKDCAQWSLRRQVEWCRIQYAQHGQLPFADVLSANWFWRRLPPWGFGFTIRCTIPSPRCGCFSPGHRGRSFAGGDRRRLCGLRSLSNCRRVPPTIRPTARRGCACPGVASDLDPDHRTDLGRPGAARLAVEGPARQLFDGSTVSMPDTKATKGLSPTHPPTTRRGLSLAQVGVLFSLSVGSVLDFAICKWKGKFQSELGLLRAMWGAFNPGDILLTDRYLCSHREIAVLKSLGVDVVARMHSQRKVDFRRGRKLGLEDHIVFWDKPLCPDWMSPKEYALLPDTMPIRELRTRSPNRAFASQRSCWRPRSWTARRIPRTSWRNFTLCAGMRRSTCVR